MDHVTILLISMMIICGIMTYKTVQDNKREAKKNQLKP